MLGGRSLDRLGAISASPDGGVEGDIV